MRKSSFSTGSHLAVLFALLNSQAVSAQNLLANPAFDAETSSWEVSGAGLVHQPADGDQAIGSAQLEGSSSAMTLSQCVTADAIGPLLVGYGGALKLAEAAGAVTDLSFEVGPPLFYATTDCMPPFLGVGSPVAGVDQVFDPPTGVWVRLDATLFIPIGIDAHSIRYNLSVSQGNPMVQLTARLDDAYLGSARLIFADGFE